MVLVFFRGFLDSFCVVRFGRLLFLREAVGYVGFGFVEGAFVALGLALWEDVS